MIYTISGLPLRRKLKITAVPTLNLKDNKDNKSASGAKRNRRMAEKERKREVEAIIEPDITSQVESDNQDTQNFGESKKTSEDTWESKYVSLLQKYDDIKKEQKDLKLKLQKNLKRCKLQVSYYKNKCLKLVRTTPTYNHALDKILTKNQINLLLKNKKRVNWTTGEISNAFTLRYYSKKAYIFMRQQLHYPLPGLSSLKRWAGKIDVRHGFLHDVMRFMKLAGESMTKLEKTVVLAFDEIKVKSVREYNLAEDEVLGPHNYMQV